MARSAENPSTRSERLPPPKERAIAGRRALATAALLALDSVATVVALRGSVWLAFERSVPPGLSGALPAATAALLACRLSAGLLAGLHRWCFRLASLPEALRIAAAGLGGTLAFAALCSGLVAGGVPPGLYVLEFFLSTTLLGVIRFGPRAVHRWLGRWSQSRAGAARAVIVGSGDTAELLARDLGRDRRSRCSLVGFVTEDPALVGSRLEGSPVLGLARDLPDLLRRHGASTVLLADAPRSGAQLRGILETCARSRARLKVVPAGLERMERLSVAMLADLSLEDLLPRERVAFDEAEIRPLVSGRCALVTGAGGSIGSELCRQLSHHGVRRLVMVDLNENELYLGARRLGEQYPAVDVRTEVADVREPRALARLGERHRPQDVFHAAAHKHVPLMEVAPDEAVKNNVFGTLHVARMAAACGASRFVLVSTDKAVNPTSVMGATKRVAELVARDLGRSSPTRVAVVRFGNVLGSAGSVVPLFSQQIRRGGPVTVTHPECTRYFMTIQEAVGLVLLAGLGGYGELCALEMGEPVRIADLARTLIALSGQVADEDIRVAYTGLRPGEKLHEELLTEQEEQTQFVRNGIRVARSPAPPRDLWVRLAHLRRCADQGDRRAVLRALQALVPTFEASAGAAARGRPAALRPQEGEGLAAAGGAGA